MAVVPFGAGTSLEGHVIPLEGGISLDLTRMNRILELRPADLAADVQPGVTRSQLEAAAGPHGLFFPVDPGADATLGGMAATNASGTTTVRYGGMRVNLLALEVVLADGRVVRTGSRAVKTSAGYNLTHLFVGSEGTFGLVTEITVKLTRLPEAVKTLLAIYDSVDDATETVAEITARGITPAACEMLDGWTIRAVEAYVHAGFPLDSAAVLLIDVDGLLEAAEAEAEEVADVCRLHHAREVRVARDARERDLLWKGRKNAFGAAGRLAPSYYTQDGVIPRTKLPATLRRISEVSKKYGLEIGNVFHAGDGNIHPIVLYDERDPDQVRRAIKAGRDILRACVEMGGSLTGGHGIGVEKIGEMPLLFSPDDLMVMAQLRRVFDPAERSNPGKVIPRPGACVEVAAPRRQAPV